MESHVTPDAIIIFPAGIMPVAGSPNSWRSTTYDESDAFGTLGGRDRVEATALLAKKYPNAFVVTTSHTLGRLTPTLAQVYGDELCLLGIERERIIQEESSDTTQVALQAALTLAKRRGWKRLLLVSSGFHIPRIEAFYKQTGSDIGAESVSSEAVLTEADPAFRDFFEKVKKSPAYQKRLTAERQGLKAIEEGMYRSASAEDKKER